MRSMNSRDDKRYTEKKNKTERARRKKEDTARLRGIVDSALALDPRIKRIKEEEKVAREAKKKAKGGVATPTNTKAQAEEEKRKAEEEAKKKEEEDKVRLSNLDISHSHVFSYLWPWALCRLPRLRRRRRRLLLRTPRRRLAGRRGSRMRVLLIHNETSCICGKLFVDCRVERRAGATVIHILHHCCRCAMESLLLFSYPHEQSSISFLFVSVQNVTHCSRF